MSSFTSHLLGRSVVRWGIIGCGDVTEVKSGPGFQKATGSQLVAVMRRNGALAADYAKRHSVPRWYDDAAKLIDDAEVDAVYVATPPDSHAHYTLAALAAGKPVYCEKPMARHTPECDRMIAAATGAGQKLFVAYYRRALPRFVLMRELIAGGKLGRVTGIRYLHSAPTHLDTKNPWRIDAAISGAGHFLDVGSHVLDLLDFVFGPLENVGGVATNRASAHPVEDNVAMSFLTGAGIPGSAAWNFASAVRTEQLEISGTDARLTCSIFGSEPLRLERSDGAVENFEHSTPPHVAQPLIQTVVDDLLGRGTCASTAESARRTSRVMDQVLASYYGGRDDEFWKRPQTWSRRS